VIKNPLRKIAFSNNGKEWNKHGREERGREAKRVLIALSEHCS
jgi:hypothetical protein